MCHGPQLRESYRLLFGFLRTWPRLLKRFCRMWVCVFVNGTRQPVAFRRSATPWMMRMLQTCKVIFGDTFSIWGWASSPLRARAGVVPHILNRARDCGVLEDGWHATKLGKRMFQRDLTVEWLVAYLEQCEGEAPSSDDEWSEDDHVYFPSPVAPLVFHNLKWKCNELHPSSAQRIFRDIVSFKGQLLHTYSRLMSRALHTAMNSAYAEVATLGLSSLLGVRDMLPAVCGMRVHPVHILFCEKDMADMFWENLAEQIFWFRGVVI